jgi:hypothetical protein
MELAANDPEQAISDSIADKDDTISQQPPVADIDFQIQFSTFQDRFGKAVTSEQMSWESFHNQFKHPTEYASKQACPLLKLARFGETRTDKGSLRHDSNVLEVYGIEGDYDGEKISPEWAANTLKELGIKAIVYTSASHTPEKPRWRVLFPFSQPLPPNKRDHWVSLANSLLDGVLARESWTLSQAFYYGKVKGGAYQCHVIEGPNFLNNSCIDLFYSPTGKPTKEKQIDTDGIVDLGEHQTDAELIRQILTSESYHNPLLSLTARYQGRGMTAKNIISTVQGFMQAIEGKDHRWQDRFDDIPRMVNDAVKKFSSKKRAQDFKLLPAHEFAQAKPLSWFIKEVIPCAEIGTIYGPSGVGKSFWSLDLMASIALGEDWRGRKVKPGRIVYIAAEGAGGFRNRVAAYEKHHKIELAQLPIVFLPAAPNFLKEDDPQAVAELINTEGQFDLIVIDTVSAVTPGANENSSESMGLLISHCKYLHQATGATIVLIDHSGKDTSQGVRGWSGKYAAMDFVIEVIKNNDCSVAKVRKQKDGVEGVDFAFKLVTVNLGVDDDLDPITSCVIEHLDYQSTSCARKSHKLGVWEECVINTFTDLCLIHKHEGEIKIPVSELVNAAIQIVAVEPGKKDRRKEYATRAITTAAAKGYFSVQDDVLIGNS